MLIFDPVVFIGGAAFVTLAVLDKYTENRGYRKLNLAIKLIPVILGFAGIIVFIEFNPMLKWIGL